jgi:hypothetical protein
MVPKHSYLINSLTPKSVPEGTKLVLFGRYVLNIYVGIIRYFTWRNPVRVASPHRINLEEPGQGGQPT